MTILDDYALALQNLITDISQTLYEFSYIDSERVLVTLKKTRNDNDDGVLAEVSGIEADGETIKSTKGRTERFFTSKSLLLNGNMVKYVIEFYVPRFINLSFNEKMITVFHELYHINPKFDGNLRMFCGKNYVHGDSVERYDIYMDFLVSKYFKMNQDKPLYDFLKHDYQGLENKNIFKIENRNIPKPELFRITWT